MQKKEPLKLSYSRSSLYLECPKKYKYKYIDGLEGDTSMALEFGTAVHEALEHNDNHYKEYKKSLDKPVLNKIFNDALLVGSNKVYTLKEKLGNKPDKKRIAVDKSALAEKVDPKKWDVHNYMEYQEHKKIGEEILDEYIADLRLRGWYDPEESEKAFEVTTTRGNVTFHGFIDFLSKKGHIVDRKTSKDPYKVKLDDKGKPIINPQTGNYIFDGDFIKKLQLIMYAIWFRKSTKKVEKGLIFDVMIKKPKGKTRLQVIDVIISEQDIQKAITMLTQVKEGIENEVYNPSPGYWCRWCNYKGICEDSAY